MNNATTYTVIKYRKISILFTFFLFFLTLLFSASAFAEIRVLAAGGDLSGPYATEEIFANGDLVGYVDRPSWDVYRELTTQDIVANYDVLLIPYNTADWQYDFDWNTRVLPFLASGGGVIWEAVMTTGNANSPLIIDQRGRRYVCPNGSICWIPDTPLNVLTVPGITNGITSDFTFTTGYFLNWDPRLSPFLQVNATGLGTITYGLYGEINAGRIILTQNAQDDSGLSTGTAAQVNAYNLLINKLQWVSSSTLPPDPNLRFVPVLEGISETQANTILDNLGLNKEVWYSPTNWVKPGNVQFQDPQAGAGTFVGNTVSITVVPEPNGAPVTVPDISNLSYSEADTALETVGLSRACCISGPSPTVPSGQIITQYPPAGTQSTVGWVVDAAMSSGPNPGFVPVVTLMTKAEAQNTLVAEGYTVNITYQNHDVIAADIVLDQSPYAGAALGAGETVNLIVSAGLPDADGDGVPDNQDNCTNVPNPDQRDTDNDGFGNMCDCDFNNDNIINASDLAHIKTNFFSSDPDSDLNGDGFVNAADLAICKNLFFNPPGPGLPTP